MGLESVEASLSGMYADEHRAQKTESIVSRL